MLSVKQRRRVYRLEGKFLGVHVRLSLGTRDGAHAEQVKRRIQSAEREGSASDFWPELQRLLPRAAFAKLSSIAGYTERPATAPAAAWQDLFRSFETECSQRIAIGKLRSTTWLRYQQTFSTFAQFLAESSVSVLAEITKPLIEKFKVWRMQQILKRKSSRGGGGLALDVAILHRVFAHAVECELAPKNPVRLDGQPGHNPETGAQPFSSVELEKLRSVAGPDRLLLLLLRHTGLRGSDAVSLRWREIDWDGREINRVTQKRLKRVIVPIHSELLFALEAEYGKRHPEGEDRILLNPGTGKILTRPRLYHRMLALGQRAGVPSARPHRFRDTFAVDMLLKGASPYDVAKLLGDTIATVETHYAPFVRELRERARKFMESDGGLEMVAGVSTVFAHRTRDAKLAN
jgi:integrase